jgi:membrane-bound lytic murein transglycosylase B
VLRIILASLLLVAASPVPADEAVDEAAFRSAIAEFKQEVGARHGFSAETLELWFADVELQQPILDAISRPAERVRPWHEYRQIFITDRRIDGGVEFWLEHREELDRIAADYGVPAQMIVAIIGVETLYGRITGRWRVLDALSTLAFAYPPRAAFFRRELEQFLLLSREERIEPRATLGSYAGAMGPPQFIPSSYRAYAVDGNGSGRRDLFHDWSDVLASVANYFKVHGWRDGEPVVQQATTRSDWHGTHPQHSLELTSTLGELAAGGYVFAADRPADTPAMMVRLDGSDGDELWVGYHNFRVITRYNRSLMYALAVHQLSEEILARVKGEAVGHVASGNAEAAP